MEKDCRETKGRTGVKYESQRLTEIVGGKVLGSYVPHGTKRIGEGEGVGGALITNGGGWVSEEER